MEFITNYWSQLTVLIGLLGYILKTILDYRLKDREQKRKFFYELKANKIIDLYSKIVEIQMIVDRRVGGVDQDFEKNIYKKRIELDKYYWESHFYFKKDTQETFEYFLKCLPFFENKELLEKDPFIEERFNKFINLLLKDFKKEIL